MSVCVCVCVCVCVYVCVCVCVWNSRSFILIQRRSDQSLIDQYLGPYATRTGTSTKKFELPVFPFLVCVTHSSVSV